MHKINYALTIEITIAISTKWFSKKVSELKLKDMVFLQKQPRNKQGCFCRISIYYTYIHNCNTEYNLITNSK